MYDNVPVYRVVACGVDRARFQKPLRYAESDARAVYKTFTGALGPAQEETSALLLGQRASRSNLLQKIRTFAWCQTDFLVLYFSGHGGSDGICLADGILDYWTLRDALSQVRSRSTLIILDACHAASYLAPTLGSVVEEVGGVIDASWLNVLASSTPGTRMFFAARADELSSESDDVRGGHFTHALLRALHRAQGDIWNNGHRWVSDREAFQIASRLVRKRWPDDAHPVSQRLDGTFPMLLSQAESPVGRAGISVTPAQSGLAANVTIQVRDRMNVPTILKCLLRGADGAVLHEKKIALTPTNDDCVWTCVISAPVSETLDDLSRLYLDLGIGVDTKWEVRLVDPYHRHTLKRSIQNVTYRRVA